MDYKQVILVREDLKLTRGKMSAQVSHASVGAALKSDKDDLKKWQHEGQKNNQPKGSSTMVRMRLRHTGCQSR